MSWPNYKMARDLCWASVSRNLRTTALVAWSAERPTETFILKDYCAEAAIRTWKAASKKAAA
jgi:hypothetical protein